jgi:hypothetical protein
MRYRARCSDGEAIDYNYDTLVMWPG